MSNQQVIIDNHGRPINYLRLAVTDRCNLRCFYCMPAAGIKYLPQQALLTYEEMERLIAILSQLGVNKVRITGGEPFVRRDLVPFLWRISEMEGIDEISITTNGVLTAKYLDELKAMGIKSVNLSLDTFDKDRFYAITRRNEFEKVEECFYKLVESGITTKINAVIMEGKNTDDIIPLAELSRKYPVAIRYIEEMPFNGDGSHYPKLVWNHRKIHAVLQNHYGNLEKIPDGPFSTSYNYRVPGYQGSLGIIAAFSRTFCGTCNRIRLTAQGTLKTCLYDNGVLDIKALMRDGASDEALTKAFTRAFRTRAKDGFEAEKNRRGGTKVSESMSTIGG